MSPRRKSPISPQQPAASRRVAQLAIAAFLMSTSLPTAAQPQATASAKAISSITFAPGKSSSGWLPFELYAGTRILIPVEVNGRAVVAMLDSGASSTVVDRSFATKLDLKLTGDHVGGAVGGSVAYSTAHGITLKAGDLMWRGGEAVAIDLTAVGRQLGREIPLFLGGEMFADTVVEIDFKGRRIAFHDPATYVAPSDAATARLTNTDGVLSIAMTVEGRPAELLFDIGNAGAISLAPRFWGQPGFMKDRATSTTFVGGAGGMKVRKVAMLDRITVGSTELNDVPVSLSEPPTAPGEQEEPLDGNLGIGVLGRFRLIVDVRRNRVLFAPPIDRATPFPVNRAGLTLRPDPKGAAILHVASGSPAASAGLIAGDVIVAVDGAPTAGQPTSNWQFGAIGTIVRLRLADDRVVALTLQRYF